MNKTSFIAIRDSLRVSPYDASRSVMENGDGKYYLINQKTQNLIGDLKDSENWEEAHQSFVKTVTEDISLNEYVQFVHNVLHLNDVEDGAIQQKRDTYLRLRLTILKKKYAAKLADLISFLFDKQKFFYLFGGLVVINLLFLFWTSDHVAVANSNWGYLIVLALYGLSVVLHEAGHVAACRRYGARHGGIGIGLYLVFPVFWADVTGLWMLPRKERIISNLGGIHAQLFMNLFIIIAYLISGSTTFIIAADFITLASIFQLWPFMRYDGYWMLSDSLKTPNLMRTSSHKARELLLEWVGKRPRSSRGYKDWSLVIYAFSNSILTILYILFVIADHGELVIHYPEATWQVVRGLVNGHIAGSAFITNYLIVTLFYYIIVRKCIDWTNKYVKLNKFPLFSLNSLKA